MARIQILELPEGDSDDRPPFVLVVDQVDERMAEDIAGWPDDISKRLGARHVICFEGTVDIPANDVPVDENGHPLFLKVHVEGEFEKFREQVQDEIRKAQADVTRALRGGRQLPDSRESTGRPTRPDGTPYNYNEIVAGGWEHCDGCRTWGQWTPEEPHECVNSQAMSATPDA